MQLINILLIAVSVLTVLSGLAIYVGSRKAERKQSLFFFLATICGALWGVSISVFLGLKPEQTDLAKLVIYGIYGPAIFLDVFWLGYVGWQHKVGKIATIIMSVLGAGLLGIVLYDPSLLYSDIVLSNAGNELMLVDGWYYWLYMGYFVVMTVTFTGVLMLTARKTTNKSRRIGLTVLAVGLAVTCTASLTCDIFLPFWVRYDLIWLGPITMAITVAAYYYAILRYRILKLETTWLKILSYVIIMVYAAMIYMVLFFIIFTALFKVANPSAEVFVLNFIMVVIVLLLMPVINELNSFVRSLINTDQVDIAYIIKKMNGMANTNVNLNELGDFLADHLHFSYIGFLIDGKLYGSSPAELY